MVKKEVLLRTVKRMHASGISDGEIMKTLQKFGMSEDAVNEVLEEVTGQVPEAAEAVEEERQKLPSREHEKIAEKTAGKVQEHLAADREATELRESTVHTEIAGQAATLRDIQKSIKQLEAALGEQGNTSSAPAADAGNLKSIEHRIAQLEKSNAELLAAAKSTQMLLKKVLEASKAALHSRK